MNVLFVGGKKNGTLGYVAAEYVSTDEDGPYQVTDVRVSVMCNIYHVAVHADLRHCAEWELSEHISVAVRAASHEATTVGFASIGKATDQVPGSEKRTVASVAGRLLEEVVELCLAAGLTTEQIYGHATDSIYNQYVKVSKASGGILYPSSYRFQFNKEELAGEIGDVRVMLEDVAYRAGLSCDFCYEDRKLAFYQKVKDGRFYANEKGLLYVRKPHMDFTK